MLSREMFPRFMTFAFEQAVETQSLARTGPPLVNDIDAPNEPLYRQARVERHSCRLLYMVLCVPLRHHTHI
jgi:hypothetical protein